MNAWDAVVWKARTDPDAPEGAEFWSVHQMREPAPFYAVEVCNARVDMTRPIDEVVKHGTTINLTKSGRLGATGREFAYCYGWSRSAQAVMVWVGTPEEYDYYM